MTFEEALKLLKQGKKIRRRGWECSDTYLTFSDNDLKLKLVADSGEFQEIYYHLSKDDILANDWEKYKDSLSEPLLTENDKSCIRTYIKYNRYVITNVLNDGHSLHFRTEANNTVGIYCYDESMFRRLDLYKSYTLKELGLDEA